MPTDAAFEERSAFFPAKDNLRLFRRSYVPKSPRAAIAVLHGYADHSGRYLEVMGHLARRNLAVHALDYRGHGQADGRRGHIDAFSQYLDDLHLFLGWMAEQSAGLPIFLLAHSHGALITLEYALAHPEAEIAGAVLTDPYLKLAFAPPPVLVAISGFLSRAIPWLGVKNRLQSSMLTRDEAIQRATERDPLYNQTATPRWFVESRRAQLEVLLRAPEYRWPTLVLLGTADPIAAGDAGRSFFERAGSADKQLIAYEGFRHEILNETGRERVYTDIDAWLDARITTRRA
jgi:alpha-beta hydrolase superfamily lysophospholipase